MSARLSILQRAFGGQVKGRTLSCPTPGHSHMDRGTSIKEVFGAPGDLIVFCHNGTQADALTIKDCALRILGEPKAGEGRSGEESSVEAINRRVMRRKAEEAQRAETLRRQRSAARIWEAATDPRGTPVETYLRGRSLGLSDAIAGTVLRWHPHGPWETGEAPMMVAAMRDVFTGEVRAIHRTALTPDDTKIDCKMLAPASGTAIMLTPAAETLVVGEGVETVLTALQIGLGPGAWAMGSAGAVKTLPVLDGVQRLVLLQEDDATSAAAVAECGERWTQAGRTVSVATPTVGNDLNDALRKHGPGAAADEIAIVRPFRNGDEPPRTEPTYPDTTRPLAEAQEAVEAAIGRFYVEAAAWDGRKAEHDPEEESADFTEPPPALMLPADVGTGKTHAVGEALKAEGAGLKTVVAMPTLRLAAEAAERFRDGPGVVGRVIRGRDNVDPDAPPPEPGAKPRKMCLDIEAVNAALMIGAPVQESCCKLKTKDTAGRKINLKCQHFDVCSYQAQMRDAPNVLFAAHSMLSKGHEVFDGIQRLIIDETFVRALQPEVSKGLSLDEIGAPLTDGEIAVLRKSLARRGTVTGALLERLVADEKDAIEWRRKAIAAALRAQAAAGVLGPVRRQFLTRVPGFGEVSAALCAQAVRDAWTLKSEVQMWPGMPAAERRKAVKAGSGIKHIRARAGVAAQLRDFLALDGARAGRVFLVAQETDHGSVTVARTHGIDRIAAPFRVPTLAIDATPPADGVLKAFLPQAEYLPRVSVQMPHVRVRQMLYAPVSKAKLEVERNRAAVRRAVLAEWVRLGRAPVLVVGQKPFADRLRSEGKLPATIAVEHYGAIAGLDQHRNVRGVICVGREQPNPWDVESIAGARTGVFPETVATPQREGATPWYGKVTRFVRMRDGSAHAVTVDEHPDPVCEATRRGICEDQIIQAIGRGRGVWRTAATPLDVMLMADVVLDLTVDEVGPWKDVREEIAMLAEGVVLASAADRATAWPAVWPSAKAAERRDQKERAARKSCPPLSYLDSILVGKGGAAFRPFRYKRNGNGQRWTEGAYDPAVVPDLRAWLEGRLGPLAGIELETAAQPNTPPAPCAQANRLPRCADHAPELAARYRLVVEREAEPFKLVPVIPEIVRWDPSQAVRWPIVPYGMKEAAA